MLFFFFFQAEDGIRDLTVTGVQTCALPISGDADQRGRGLVAGTVVAGERPAQAVILAGGQGTRLRPLTLARAKPVVPLLNRPFLAFQLALLREHGVTDVILACSYRVDDVRAALGDASQLGVRLRYVVEKEPLGTGGGVRNAADLVAGAGVGFHRARLPGLGLFATARVQPGRGSRPTLVLSRGTGPAPYFP